MLLSATIRFVKLSFTVNKDINEDRLPPYVLGCRIVVFFNYVDVKLQELQYV